MDPDACLEEIRDLVGKGHIEDLREDFERLCELVEALDDWVSKGGRLPKAWL